MDENSPTESSFLPIIEQNEKFLSTVVTSSELTDKVMNQIDNEEQEEIRSTKMILLNLMDNLLGQIESNFESAKEENLVKEEKQGELKPTTRTLRSHARGKMTLAIPNQNLHENRRVSKRRRVLESKKTIFERLNHNETSSNSDDQISINGHLPINEDTNINGDEDSNSIGLNKSIHTHSYIETLPPNKRRLRERNAALLNSLDTSNTMEENLSMETTKDIPTNGIKQYLQIRQQVFKN